MKRFDDWVMRLALYIEASRERAFAWGEWDCATFVAGAVHAITGVPVGLGYCGAYSSAAEAAHLVPDEAALARYVGQALQTEEIGVGLACRGDVVMRTGRVMGALGIVMGPHAFFVGERGLVTAPTLQSVRAWRV